MIFQTASEVKQFRDDNAAQGMSLFEARGTLMKRALIVAVDTAQTVENLRPVLRHLIEKMGLGLG